MTFPMLYHRGKGGAMYSWRIWTESNVIYTEYGQVGGQMQIATKEAGGKNKGRANATTDTQQADSEAQSMWVNKRDRKYSETPDAAQALVFLPMLAHDYKKLKGGIPFPADVQPKLDGVRCLASWYEGKVRLLSRGGKEYNVEHIRKALEDFLPADCVLDGELYIHGVGFQTITSWVKRVQDDQMRIEYHVYDCPAYNGEDKIWTLRRQDLATVTSMSRSPNIKMVETVTAYNDPEVHAFQGKFISEGYEGAIVRSLNGVYMYGYRSSDLLKVKTFMDSEYEIVGYENGVGKFSDCCIFVCKTPSGKEFRVCPKGTLEDRKQTLREAQMGFHIGELLKVKYFELTDDGIPRFPVGIGYRMREDMSV